MPHAYQLPHTSTTFELNSFYPRTIRDCNCLSTETATAPSVEAFKARLHKARTP